MKRSFSMIAIGFAACVVMPAFVVGCGDASTETEAHAGTAAMALSGVSGTGKTYRLRTATFKISGTAAKTVSSEDDPTAASILLELKAGGYLANLTAGWVLEVQAADGTYSSIPAVLTSTNPLPFTVVDQQTTKVTFQFKAGMDVVQLGDGRAEIGISVDDGSCAGGSCDQDGDGVSTPADCNDTNAAIFPGAMEICDGQDNNCDGQVDEGGVCGGGNCDATGACDTCQQCAQNGACLSQTNACINDSGCIGLSNCLGNCTDQACVDNCAAQTQPSSIDIYNALSACLTCACQVSCQVPAGSCG